MNWRPMSTSDLCSVKDVADQVHANYPEDEAVFRERFEIYPQGCFVLEDENECVGYLISHPWHFGNPPELNVLLKKIPVQANSYYIHDIAILPRARGSSGASEIAATVIENAGKKRFPNVSLIAVNSSKPFWERLKFKVFSDPSLTKKLASYDEGAQFMVRDLRDEFY